MGDQKIRTASGYFVVQGQSVASVFHIISLTRHPLNGQCLCLTSCDLGPEWEMLVSSPGHVVKIILIKKVTFAFFTDIPLKFKVKQDNPSKAYFYPSSTL